MFNAILENATRICEAQVAEIILTENGAVCVAAGYGDAPRLPDSEKVPLDRPTVMGRSICDQKPVHVADLQNAGDEFASGREFAKRFRHRTIGCVPLLHEGGALGTISVPEVRPFEQKVIVWDKVLGLGSTDPITGLVADWSGMIITAYVGGRSIEKVARVFARRP